MAGSFHLSCLAFHACSGWVVRPVLRSQFLPLFSGMFINSLKGTEHRASLWGHILGAKHSVFLDGGLCLAWSPPHIYLCISKIFLTSSRVHLGYRHAYCRLCPPDTQLIGKKTYIQIIIIVQCILH